MKRGRLYLLPALLLPAIGMMYLYNQNSKFTSFLHVLAATLAMVALSAVGYGLLRLIFKSDASAFAGCAGVWVMFFVLGSKTRELLRGALGDAISSVALMAVVLALVVALALLLRRYRGEALGAISSLMAVALLLMNLVPAAWTGVRVVAHRVDENLYKTEFATDASLPSPNVYWIHTDGMLGFEAFEDWFGDDQAAFRQALAERGFGINPGASLETGHTTSVAVPSLLSPSFYDGWISKRASTHEQFMAMRSESVAQQNELARARVLNETRLAFEAKGYHTQTIATLDYFYPPVTGRMYEMENNKPAALFSMNNPTDNFVTMMQWIDLSEILYGASGGLSMGLPMEFLGRTVIDHGVERQKIQPNITKEQVGEVLLNAQDRRINDNLVLSLRDLLDTKTAPAFTFVFYTAAHYPFIYNEDGSYADGDVNGLGTYAGNHRYAAKLLINLLDMILEADPGAVIVIQADHGLHGVDRKEIVRTFGEDAVLPLWNQVMSAIRVPDEYKTDELPRTMDNPLNMSRYLMNTFVGEDYRYLAAGNPAG